MEIGTEELPARFLKGEEISLLEMFEKALAENGIKYGSIKAMATPRRLALVIEDIAKKEDVREDVVIGPPVAAAYDADGNPTPALSGFVKGHGVTLEDIFREHTPKGEYVAARVTSGGRSTADALAEICPRIITSLTFPKSMRWGGNDITYGRPLHWIVALLDDKVVPFRVGPVASGRSTWGHRVHGNGPHELEKANEYENVLENRCKIVLDPAERRNSVMNIGAALARDISGEVVWKEGLLNEVTGLVEHPVPLIGNFDASYLEIPEEVLLTSMETHQKSFGVRGADGKLLPCFLTVLNMDPPNVELVRKGWERVLRARLEDARFFWQTDSGTDFDEWLKKLDNVIFIGPLGTLGEKSRRLEELTQWLAWQLTPNDVNAAYAKRAGRLAKADLVSSMVGEFDTLQGIMGGIYAANAGEPAEVAQALQEQYLPAGPDSPTPASVTGAFLSIADKADTLSGCFGLDMVPTGAADPNGLRRCALGIIRILIERKWRIDVGALFTEARRLYGKQAWKLDDREFTRKLMEFFKGRLRNYFLLLGYDTVLVDAVLDSGVNDPADAQARLDAMAAFGKTPNFVKSAHTLKRVENIGKKSSSAKLDWDDNLARESAEKALSTVLKKALPNLDNLIENGKYAEALESLNELAMPIDNFFDNVLVLDEDEKTRENRLSMLNALARRYNRIARFSGLQI